METNSIELVAESRYSKIEEYLNKEGLLHFEQGTPEGETTEEFLLSLFKLNEKQTTLNVDGSVQCVSQKRRSIGDLYRLCKYYRPITLKDLQEELIKLTNKEILKSLVCPQIHKRTYTLGNTAIGSGWAHDSKDEFNLSYPHSEKPIASWVLEHYGGSHVGGNSSLKYVDI